MITMRMQQYKSFGEFHPVANSPAPDTLGSGAGEFFINIYSTSFNHYFLNYFLAKRNSNDGKII